MSGETGPLPDGTVTAADLYRELLGLRGQLGELVTLTAVVQDRQKLAAEADRDHEARLRVLEKFRAQIYGMAMIVGAVGGIISSWLAAHLH